jgi:hypothetical protein
MANSLAYTDALVNTILSWAQTKGTQRFLKCALRSGIERPSSRPPQRCFGEIWTEK